jgi:glycosyltransferase involved in cell wall biosynthesis
LSKLLKIKPKREAVIFNGDNPDYYKKIESFKSPYPRNVLMMAKWYNKRGQPRVQKRTKDHLKIARDYTAMDEKCCFWIVGNCKDKFYESDRVRYVGWKTKEELATYLKMADVYLYVPWYDWCPNSAVEAMCAGEYLICSNNGGHAEMAEGYGTVVPTDETINPKILIDVQPPKPDRDAVLDALNIYFLSKPSVVVNPRVRIEYAAKEYKKMFDRILK